MHQQNSDQIKRVLEVIRSAPCLGKTPQDVARDIERTVPGFAKYIPNNPTELAAYLKILAAVIITLLGILAANKFEKNDINIYINNSIEDVYEQPKSRVNGAAIKKTGRNQPCPCGSDKKFKKCCGSSRGR